MTKFNILPFFIQVQMLNNFKTRLIKQDESYIKLFETEFFSVQVAIALEEVNPVCVIDMETPSNSKVHDTFMSKIIEKIIEIEKLIPLHNG